MYSFDPCSCSDLPQRVHKSQRWRANIREPTCGGAIWVVIHSPYLTEAALSAVVMAISFPTSLSPYNLNDDNMDSESSKSQVASRVKLNFLI